MANLSSIKFPALILAALSVARVDAANTWTLLGWSDLGVNAMERDYSLFAIYPPYGTIHAQLIDATGALYTGASGVTMTYEAIADPNGSINTTSSGKTNFFQFAQALFGANPAGSPMPGSANTPQAMTFESSLNRFTATGISITPYDDSLNLNYYPMLKLTARNASGSVLATARITLPVSNEVECRGCHASGTDSAAQPIAGWANNSNPNLDFKINILQTHDEKNRRNPAYARALASLNYSSSGLLATANAGTPVSCTACHSSNQFGAATPGITGIESLTSAMHSNHAGITDPATNDSMDNGTDRATCYNCHPGTHTQSLRGAMGRWVGTNGSLQIQCQSCHGSMSAISNPSRNGWIDLPNCQSCHTGTATTAIGGQLILTDALDSNGNLNQTTDATFATTPNQPVAGASLYRFSTGHGNLQCSACHGSTHAEIPSDQPTDNLQASDLTGQTGAIRECSVCHQSGFATTAAISNGGPHGMHDVGNNWVNEHTRYVGRTASACAACHGADYRGTVLSAAYTTRTLSTRYGTFNLFRGYIVSCYTCHNGPNGGEGGTGTQAAIPAVNNASAAASSGSPVTIPVTISNAGVLRIISQPQYGAAYPSGSSIVYRPNANFEGTDHITFAARNSGGRDSNLGTATVQVTSPVRPIFTAPSVSNAASYVPGIAPGMIAYIKGSGLGPSDLASYELNSGGFIEKLAANTRVLFNGIPAPVIYTSDGQVSAVVPYAVAKQGTASVAIEYNGIQSTAATVAVTPALPGVFTVNASGQGDAAVINQDGSVNSATSPAPRGSVVTLFVTGGGMEAPAQDGLLAATPYPTLVQPVSVMIGGQPAVVQYSGALPGAVSGMIQVNATVPSNLHPGPAQVVVSIGATPSASGVTIEVN